MQVIHVAVTGCPEHGCDTASFFYRTSLVILPWCPSKSKFFCLSPTAFVLPHFVQLPPQLSFSSSRIWSSLTFEPLLTILKFLVTSTASAAFSSHMCNSHLTLHLYSSFPSLLFPSDFSSFSTPRSPAGPHFPLCLPRPHLLCPAAPFAAFSPTFSSQKSFCT